METIGFIGAGTVGTALAIRLSEKGYPVIAAASKRLSSAERLASQLKGCEVCNSAQAVADIADIVFVTTPDDVIAIVAEQITWRTNQSVVHCSGAESLDILEPAAKSGAQTGSMHPLQSFASVEVAIKNLTGSAFGLEGESPLLNTLKDIVNVLGGHWVELKADDKVLYHTAAVFACNYMITGVKIATDLWESFGIPPAEATNDLLPLIRGTVNNLSNIGLPNCLTGPIARGDIGTIKRHLAALKARSPELLPAYKEMGLQTIPIAEAKGKIDKEKATELRNVLMHYDD